MDYNKFKDKFLSSFGIDYGWGEKLQPFIEGEECDKIYTFLKHESSRGKVICPESKNTFRAFAECPYTDLKVIFIAQDPYPWVKNDIFVADGIALSCRNTRKLQPSLDNFYTGICEDLYKGANLGIDLPTDLKFLCNQGILMLNSSLTCELNKPGSHEKLWHPLMKYVLSEILGQYNTGLIYVLCGKSSQYLERWINPLNNYIFKIEHPAKAAHESRFWNHENIFTKINVLLKEHYNFEPDWLDQNIPF